MAGPKAEISGPCNVTKILEKAVVALTRLMPNMGGPRLLKRGVRELAHIVCTIPGIEPIP